MAVVSYKCPNCDGPLVFRPRENDFYCDFCQSRFNKSEVEAGNSGAAETVSAAPKTQITEDAELFEKEAVTYSCPSCGAEIITAESTAATQCYYCHNPVILSGKLSREFRPDRLIPFAISKDEAIKRFKDFCAKKRMLPKEFLTEGTFESVTGVYYPYYIVDAKIFGQATAKSKTTRTWIAGNFQYTEISDYRHERKGDLDVEGIAFSAYKDGDRNLLKYVCPFDESKSVDFAMMYLSGFQAEKRQLGKADLYGEIEKKLRDIAENQFKGSINAGGAITSFEMKINDLKDRWEYFLFLLWVMTYNYRGKLYRYAINGQTGKLYGELPVDKLKLFTTAAVSALAVLAAILIYGGFAA